VECAFYRNHWVAAVNVSFSDKTAPAAKKATNHDRQGMLKVIQHALTVTKL
jgi:hypothetical protein